MEERNVSMTQDEMIQELITLLQKNNMNKSANEVFETAVYVDSLEKKLYLLEKFAVDRNKCWITLDNLFGNNYIVQIEAENRSGLPVALSRGIPIQMPSKTNQIQWQGVKL